MTVVTHQREFDLDYLQIDKNKKEALDCILKSIGKSIGPLPPRKQKRFFELWDLLQTARQDRDVLAEREIIQTMAEVLFRCDAGLQAEDIDSGVTADGAKALKEHRKYVAGQIRKLRCAAKLTQIQLADLAGLPQPHISRLETGEHAPTYLTIEKIAVALGVAPGVIDPSFD